jgi:uncharacterized membrane protein YedE/YeeE
MFDDIAGPLVGGVLIGLSATLLLLSHGRILGISGIVAGTFREPLSGHAFRLWFLAGLIGTGIVLGLVAPEAVAVPDLALAGTGIAGLLVGVGTRLANGCTSGHGVCGNGRLSPRSLVATVTFIATGAATVLVVRLAGGVP